MTRICRDGNDDVLIRRDLSESYELSEGNARRSKRSSKPPCSTLSAACTPPRPPARSAHSQHRGNNTPEATNGSIADVTHTNEPHTRQDALVASAAGSPKELQANDRPPRTGHAHPSTLSREDRGGDLHTAHTPPPHPVSTSTQPHTEATPTPTPLTYNPAPRGELTRGDESERTEESGRT